METADGDPRMIFTGVVFSLINFQWIHGLELLFIVILIICSALVSGSEAAFFSLKKQQLEMLRNKYKVNSNAVLSLYDKPKRLLATILVTNTLVNIMIAILASNFLESVFVAGTNPAVIRQLIEVVGITFILVLFGEVMPKVYATQYNLSFAAFMAFPLIVLGKIFYPISYLLIRSSTLIESRLQKSGMKVSIDEIRHAIEITSGEETSLEEKKILRGIINFGNIYVKQIMRPRTDVEAFEVKTSFSTLIDQINKNRYSRLPIYNGSFDNVVGILYIKDLIPYLQEPANFDWFTLLRQPYFVPETKKIDVLLQEFKQKKVHMAIVVDEYGGTSGIVTLEDVLEEIVGEINDEFDDEDVYFNRLDDDNVVFDGKTTLTDVGKVMDLNEDIFDPIKGEAESIGGLMIELSGRIPELGQSIQYKDYTFTADMVDRRRVRRVKVSRINSKNDNRPEA